eukprot:COSAG05_NODE_193_length_14574_cov_23.070812_14_plen_174_part_00
MGRGYLEVQPDQVLHAAMPAAVLLARDLPLHRHGPGHRLSRAHPWRLHEDESDVRSMLPSMHVLVSDASSLLRSHPLNASQYTAYAIAMLIYFLHFMIYILGVYFGWETPFPFTRILGPPARNIHARMHSFELMSQVTYFSAYIHQSTTRCGHYLPACLSIRLVHFIFFTTCI